MATLGTAYSYEAFLVNSSTEQTLLRLPWSSIRWQRVRNDVSQASVTVAQADGGIECCAALGTGMNGWEMLLRIERNDGDVWDGPVTSMKRPKGSRDLVIGAHDRSALMFKRLIATYRFHDTVSPNTIIRSLLADAGVAPSASNPPYALSVSSPATSTEQMTREYFVERLERIFDVVKEVCDNSTTGYWTCLTDTIHTHEATIATALGLYTSGKSCVLSEQNTIDLPGIDVDFLGMATVTYAGAAGQGINGFPLVITNLAAQNLFLSSTLQQAAPSSRVGESADLTLLAGREAADKAAPSVNIEQVQLAPNFGSEFFAADLSNLLPGVQFRVDFDTTCAFNFPVAEYREAAGVPGMAVVDTVTGVRMDQLDVTVSRAEGDGISEVVLASCRPIITGNIT